MVVVPARDKGGGFVVYVNYYDRVVVVIADDSCLRRCCVFLCFRLSMLSSSCGINCTSANCTLIHRGNLGTAQ
jgi:hypothetical protein